MKLHLLPCGAGHDVKALFRQWATLARRTGWTMGTIAHHDGWDIPVLTRGDWKNGGVYLSAGIHGDEPAAPQALLTWAQNHPEDFNRLCGIIFPCLNPWGLAANQRTDRRGRDLNRIWHKERHPLVGPIRRLLAGADFHLAVSLHEDFEAAGFYLYEPMGQRPGWGGSLLRTATRFLPIEPRRTIDGRRVTRPGHFYRRINANDFEDFGWPEAIYLHLVHTRRSFTLETPSEFDLPRRVAAHVAVLHHLLQLARA